MSMSRELKQTILACLGVSQPPQSHLEQLARFRPKAWSGMLRWLDHSGLALLFWHRLKESGAEGAAPPEIAVQLDRSLWDHERRVAHMANEFDSINQCLEEAGIEYAALKGFALIPECCPMASLRTTYDYDYLVAPESMERVDQVLRANGFARKQEPVDHPAVYFHTDRPPWSPLSRNDLYSSKFPRTVEMHWRLWDSDPLKIPLELPRDPLGRRQKRRLTPPQLGWSNTLKHHPALEFYALSDTDDLIFQILHAFKHILQNWCRLCSLLDIACFLEGRSQDNAFWDRFTDRIESVKSLPEIVAVVFSLAVNLFEARMPDGMAGEMAQRLPSPLALWVQRYGHTLALNHFSGSKFALFLHREFIPDETVWREIERSCLFPFHRPNQAATASTPAFLPRWSANWKQGWYVAQRLKHHLMSAARYELESHRWERMRTMQV